MKPRLFRAFVTEKYFENREEYDSCGQVQPHTFDEYVRGNLAALKKMFKNRKKEVDKPAQ